LRVSLILMVILFLLFVSFVATQVPQVQEAVPLVKTFNSDLKRVLGLQGSAQNPSGEFDLANPGRTLKEVPDTLPEVKECGPPPENPWTRKEPVSPADAERYQLALQIWEYCKKESHSGGDKLPTFSPSGQDKPGNGLDSYPDDANTSAAEAPP
jgi:hypothetical protein